MRTSWCSSFASMASLPLAVCCVPAVSADMEFTRLNACADISSVFQQLRGAREPSDDECRAPSNAVERGIAKAFVPSGQKVCVMRRAPIPALNEFGCLRTYASGQSAATCFRSVPGSLAADYKSGYKDKYASAVSTYLNRAATCPGTSGDAAIAPITTFSPFLLPVAEYQVGFLIQYGSTRPGNAAVWHGLAKTSPDVAKAGIDAIEVVAYSWSPDNSASSTALNYIKLGNWRVKYDDGEEFVSELNKAARKQGGSLVAGVFDLSVTRAADAPAFAATSSLADDLASKAAASLEGEGFDAMSESDLKGHTGMDSTEMMAKVAKQMPYGAQNLASRFAYKPRVTMLMRTSGPRCTDNDRGAFGAYILRNDGRSGVSVDFGSVSIFILGFGACGRQIDANKSYVRELVSDAKEAVLSELKAR